PEYAHIASRWAWIANLRDRVPGLAWLSEKLLHFSARRPLPVWRSDTFWTARDPAVFASAEETLAAGNKGAVLFVDTFTGTFERENAHAAALVLRTAGYTVHAIEKAGGHHCCGRTYLAAGMVTAAKDKARALIDALLPFAHAGIAIVGLEPSCLLTLRDETLAMGLGAAAQTVARHALLFEEFLAREAKAGRFTIGLKAAGAPLAVHVHCHQKAFGTVGALMEVLRLIPEAAPQLIEGSCCGMAGSFGYEAEHYDVSLKMAELTLLPALRKQPGATIVANGTSCRHQIADGVGAAPMHVARLLESLL
ncbi:MAG: (Fe-S)-binding protein, partial [Candidatus Binataceae bacterium]